MKGNKSEKVNKNNEIKDTKIKNKIIKKKNEFSEENLNSGHRARIRKKFLISKKSIADYELLEILLFLAIPRKNTKDIAKKLFTKFGCLQNIVQADIEQLRDVEGIGESALFILQLFHEIHLRLLKENIIMKEVKINSIEAVKQYCKSFLGNLVKEEIFVLFVNKASLLVAEEQLSSGGTTSVKIYKNILITKATQNGASGIILVHNHPSGKAEPSNEDKILTYDLQKTLQLSDIILIDHLIVSKNSVFSFAKEGLLDKNKLNLKDKSLNDNQNYTEYEN